MKLAAEQKYQLILDISHKVRDTLDLDEILKHLLDTVKVVMEYDAAGIFVLTQDLVHERNRPPREMIAGISRRGFTPGPPEQDDMLMHGHGITGFVIRTQQSVVVPDVRQDSRYVQGRLETLSEIAVPIILNDRAIGALNIESDRLSAYTEDDIEVLQFFADAAAISIQKAMLHKQLLEQELVRKQLETARDVQSRLLPKKAPNIAGYDIAGICVPAYEIGGDYFDYIPLSHNQLGLAVADVSGHGIPSALVMTAFRALLRTQARRIFSPSTIASAINQFLPEITADNHFVTVLYAILDPSSGSLSYISCGHPPAIIIRASGETELLEQHNAALGIFQNLRYTDGKAHLNVGDTLVIYTDGVTELVNNQGRYFGVQQMLQVIHENIQFPAGKLVSNIMRAAQDFSDNIGFLDDITLVIVRRKPE